MSSIRSEPVAFDTNVYVFGSRADADHPACQHLIESVADLLLYVPQQVVTEVHRNLRHVELRAFYAALENAAGVAWGLGPAPDDLVRRYGRLVRRRATRRLPRSLRRPG